MTFTSKIIESKLNLAFLIHFQQVNALFWVNFLVESIWGLAPKSVFDTKFAYANLAEKISAVNLLNSRVVINLSSLWSVSFFWISLILVS